MDSSHCHCSTQAVSGVAYGVLCNKVVGGLSLSLWETVSKISDYTPVSHFKVNIIVFCQAATELKHLLELTAHLSPIPGKNIKKDEFKLPLLKLQYQVSTSRLLIKSWLKWVWRAYALPRPLFRWSKKSPCNQCSDVRSIRRWTEKRVKNTTCQREPNSRRFKLNILILDTIPFSSRIGSNKNSSSESVWSIIPIYTVSYAASFYFRFLINLTKENGTHISHTDIGATDTVFVPFLFLFIIFSRACCYEIP